MQQTIRLESFVLRSGRNFFDREGFVEVVTPRMVRASGACENINTLFEVSVDGDTAWFSGKRAYLAQTGQLYLEAFVPVFGKVYTVGPSFRAESAADDRHLCEFQMIEIEFAGGFEKLLGYIEGYIRAIARDAFRDRAFATKELGLSPAKLDELASLPRRFPRVTYDEAINILASRGEAIAWGDDISAEREQALVSHFGGFPLFITHFPDPMWDHGKEIEVEKFFNMLPDGKGRVYSCDTILPGAGEAVGAAARVHELEMLQFRLKNSRMFELLKARGGGLDDFEWYFEKIRSQGAVPHAGCGFGVSRILKWLRGVEDIRSVVAFPVNREVLV